MIHHVSIDAEEPERTANVLAKLMGGTVRKGFPFGAACTALANDEHGTLVECFPRGSQSFHAAFSSNLSDEAILASSSSLHSSTLARFPKCGWQIGSTNLASPSTLSWNHLVAWLRQVEEFRKAS